MSLPGSLRYPSVGVVGFRESAQFSDIINPYLVLGWFAPDQTTSRMRSGRYCGIQDRKLSHYKFEIRVKQEQCLA